MLWFWPAMFVAAVVAYHLQRSHLTVITLKHRYTLYSIRDALRDAAMHGEVSSNKWVFKYLDTSITRSIAVLDRLNLWSVLFLAIVRSGETRETDYRRLHRALDEPGNEMLKECYQRYVEECWGFILERNGTLAWVLRVGV